MLDAVVNLEYDTHHCFEMSTVPQNLWLTFENHSSVPYQLTTVRFGHDCCRYEKYDFCLDCLFCLDNGYVLTHYSGVIIGAMPSQITGISIVNSTVFSTIDRRKHQSSASLASVRGIHRWPVNSPHRGPVRGEIFPFDDVIMYCSSSPRS